MSKIEQNSSSNSSSNSSDSEDGELLKKPRIKKKRSTARREPVKEEDDDNDNKDDFFGKKVADTLDMIRSGSAVVQQAMGENDDVEAEDDIFSKKKKKKAPPLPKPKFIPRVEEIESDEDDDIEVISSSQEKRAREKSPTPPPTPNMAPPAKKKRLAKGVKNALGNIERTIQARKYEKFNRSLEAEPEVIDLDDYVDSPTKKEMTVKINSRSGIQRFQMDMSSTFAHIIKEMCQHEGVQEERAIMFIKDRTIEPYDTPATINLHIADILEFRIMKQSEVNKRMEVEEVDEDDPNYARVIIQGKDPKSRLRLPCHMKDPLEKILRQYAFLKNLQFDKLTFSIEGEKIQSGMTPEDFDLEDDDLIDYH